MEKVNTIINARWIITCETKNQVLENHSIVVKDEKILAILPTDDAASRYETDATQNYNNHIIMPGLVNCHTHTPMNLFRGLADDLELMDWLEKHIWPAEGKWVNDNFVYDGSQLAIAEMIRGGTTCFNDMYFFMPDTAKAAEEAGIRAHVGMTIIDVPTAWAKTTEEYFAKAVAFYEQFKDSKLVTPTLAPHSPYTVSLDNLERVQKLAHDYHLKINIHLQEAPSEIARSLELHKKRPLQRLNDIGMVNKDLIAIHMTQIDADDLAILEKHKPSIVHCPESNMKLVSGCCPVELLQNIGINVALGTDGAASNNDLDMFGEMRTAAFLGKVTADDPKAVSAEDVIRMATINGAKALGMENVTGTITSGKYADFIAIDMNQIETQPLYHPVSQIVYATPRNQVSDVWVAGKQLMKDRKLLTLDEEALLAKAKSWAKKLVQFD